MDLFLIETDPISADSVAFYLEQEGFSVTSFFNTAQALEAVGDAAPDLVITEVILSGMSGFRLCQTLKDQPTTAHIPVLVLTVLEAEERARAAGADAFLLKPADKATLARTVRELLTARARGGR
jgi:CheY-like chemotaxis protein